MKSSENLSFILGFFGEAFFWASKSPFRENNHMGPAKAARTQNDVVIATKAAVDISQFSLFLLQLGLID